jgi:hypothetical protein
MPRLEDCLPRVFSFLVETLEVVAIDLLVEAVLDPELVAGTVGRPVTVSTTATVT